MATPTYATVLAQINTFIVTNGNNEITAEVLNPILVLITDFANNTIGDLDDLTTDETNVIVDAINSLKVAFEDLNNNGVQLLTGYDDPNVTPPPTFNYADFYMELDITDDSPIQLWQWSGTEWNTYSNVYSKAEIDFIVTGLDERIDALESEIPSDYAKLVYVNNTNPNSATIFSEETPPTVNDPLLEEDSDNLYIGTDASNWVWDLATSLYKTEQVADTSNFLFPGTEIPAGNNKNLTIYRPGSIQSGGLIQSVIGFFIIKNGSDTVNSGGRSAFYNASQTSAMMFQLNASNGIDVWSFASGSWTKRFTFSNSGNLTIHTTPTTSAGSYHILTRNDSTGEIEQTAGASETTTTMGALINSAGAATPNDTDLVATAESGGLLKKITWTNVKAFLKTYYDTIYTTTSAVASQITTALATFKTANYLDATSSIQTQLDSKISIYPVTETGTSFSLANADNGKITILTASCTVTIPNGLVAGFEHTIVTLAGVTLTVALGGSVTLFNNVGTTMAEKLSCTIKNRTATNQYITAGNL